MPNTQKKQPTPGTEILQHAHQIVNQDRQNTYGHPKDDYTKVTNIFETLTDKKLTLTEALLFMVSVKLARLKTNLNQGHLHYDTLLDTIGYLTCINMIHQQESTTNDKPKTNTNPKTRPTKQKTTKRNKTTPKRKPTTPKTTQHTPKKVDKTPKTR